MTSIKPAPHFFHNANLAEFLTNWSSPFNEPFPQLRDFANKNQVPILKKEVMPLLSTLLALKKPDSLLEVGTAIGYSSLFFQKMSPSLKDITTLELSKPNCKLAKANFQRYSKAPIRLLEGDARILLEEEVSTSKSYSFIFVDARKDQYLEYFNLILPLLKEDGMAIFDNVLFKGWVADYDHKALPSPKESVRVLSDFNHQMAHLEGFRTSLIPLGDGLMLLYRNSALA